MPPAMPRQSRGLANPREQGNEFDQIATAAFDKVIRHEPLRLFALARDSSSPSS